MTTPDNSKESVLTCKYGYVHRDFCRCREDYKAEIHRFESEVKVLKGALEEGWTELNRVAAESAIETLRDENKRLESEVKAMEKVIKVSGQDEKCLKEWVEHLETRLKEATEGLERIACSAPCRDGHESFNSPGQPCDQRIAEETLKRIKS